MASATKENQILHAAEKLFTSRRFHEVTLDDVAKTARVGKGTIYRYFKNKDDLFLRVVMSGYDESCALIERTAAEAAPFDKQLQRMLQEISRLYLRKHALFRLLHSEAPRIPFMRGPMRAQWKKHRQTLHAHLAAWLRRSAEAGYVRHDFPPETLAACMMGMLRGYLMQTNGKSKKAPPLDGLIELFLRGASSNRKEAR